ncbi:aminodeoxychorismate lyase [Lysobacter koreensis]|uniref:Aminodeoxychorismate lyase n=1 Tax=Lysobacter koreensis TaxID=266122 RepID=A0ABW2YKB7_9GAMM
MSTDATSARVFVGTEPAAGIPAGDRGFAYGDGVFETMRAHAGRVPWWDTHWARLVRGAQRLRLVLPDAAQVRAEAGLLLADGGDAVLKLVVSRGAGERGYAPAPDPIPTWVLSRHPPPPPCRADGLALRWCETRLSIQPALAGIKHCNRLEQVLARAECDAAGVDEGLMRSTDGDVVCATAANLFVLKAGRWATPAVERCGVEGVCRAWALDQLGATQMQLDVTDVEAADALFLCNAVRGILPVTRLADRRWPLHAEVLALQRRLATEHPAFATPAHRPEHP